MITENYLSNSYKALHHLCIMARYLCKSDPDQSYQILDVMDYLIGLAQWPEDRTEEFRSALIGYSEDVPQCKAALEMFEGRHL